MTAVAGASFPHFDKRVRLEQVYRLRIEKVIDRFFHGDDYQLLARLHLERSECSFEVDLEVFSRKLHVVIKKIGGDFGEAFVEVAESLKALLWRERQSSPHRARTPQPPEDIF